MKAFLMHPDRDFDSRGALPPNEEALTRDLELTTLFGRMALGDPFLLEMARRAVLCGLGGDLEGIRYRQDVLKDCLKNASTVRAIYAIAVDAIEGKRKIYFGSYSNYPSSVLYGAIEVLQMFMGKLGKLMALADPHAEEFASEGFKRFFAMLRAELDDEYFARVGDHLKELKFRDGVLVSAELGKGNVGANYVLRKRRTNRQGWLRRLLAKRPPVYTLRIAERDETGARILSELRNRGIHLVANALAQSTDHILAFFEMVRTELAFYVGCLNLHEEAARKGKPICFPVPVGSAERRHSFTGLYDICLALNLERRVVGNDVDADGRDLVVITGANEGGKSTFLRSVGLSQLMMQCGMFVPAVSFTSSVCDGLFTHFKRREDATMKSGKLDEELGRMSDVVDRLKPRSMVLLNESFAATNEREGSEIARQIVSALLEARVRTFFVTHLYEFAHAVHERRLENAAFLRAERSADGRRTFRLIEGEPLETSFGEDLYKEIFSEGTIGVARSA